MNKFSKLLILGLSSMMMLTGCINGNGQGKNDPKDPTDPADPGTDPGTDPVTPSMPSKYSDYESQTWTASTEDCSWTILIYMCGSDLESGTDDEGETHPEEAGFATLDIQEILSVKNQPNDVNIVIQTGGAKEWNSKYGIKADKLQRFHVANQKLVKDSELSLASMGKSSTFKSFLEWGLSTYPADKTGLIFWNHGGAMDGVCFDENYKNDSLTSSEVKGVLSSVLGSKKLEFVGYDACLMQVQDIADYNSNYFNYMVGAQESEAGEGWAYNYWIDDLYAKKDTKTILKAICDGFIDSYDETYGAQGYPNDQTQSFLDLSKAKTYKTAFENLATSLKSAILKSSFTKEMKKVKRYADSYFEYKDYYTLINEYGYTADMFETYKEDGVTYYILPGYYDYGLFDVYDFMFALKGQNSFSVDGDLLDELYAAYCDYVVYNRVGEDAGHSNGLCLVCPMEEYFVENNYYPSSETAFTNWYKAVTSSSRNY